jgi:hypothetical protein
MVYHTARICKPPKVTFKCTIIGVHNSLRQTHNPQPPGNPHSLLGGDHLSNSNIKLQPSTWILAHHTLLAGLDIKILVIKMLVYSISGLVSLAMNCLGHLIVQPFEEPEDCPYTGHVVRYATAVTELTQVWPTGNQFSIYPMQMMNRMMIF